MKNELSVVKEVPDKEKSQRIVSIVDSLGISYPVLSSSFLGTGTFFSPYKQTRIQTYIYIGPGSWLKDTNTSRTIESLPVSMQNLTIESQAQRALPYKSAAQRWQESCVRPVDSLSLMRDAAKGESGVANYTRRVADVELEGSTPSGSNDGDSSSSSTAVGPEPELPRQSAPVAQPQESRNSSAHQRRYAQSLEHEVPNPREQLRNRSLVPQAPALPELAPRTSRPRRSETARVQQARSTVRADEISRALSPPASLRGYESREADSRISVISDYIYPSGKEPKPFIPDPAKTCDHPDCPLTSISGITHRQGPYYHHGIPNPRLDAKIFGASDPPKFVWTAYDDCFLRNGNNLISMAELDKVIPFAFFHGFADDDFIARFEISGMSEHARDMRKELRMAYKNRPKKKKTGRE